MKKLFVVLSILVSQSALADVLGSYTGCGISSAFGPKQVILHLTALPTDLNGGLQYTGSFTWYQAPSANFFPEVQIDGNRIFMRMEIKPVRDFGVIVKTLELTVNADESLSGIYKTNAMQGDGRVQSGNFTAKKFAGNEIPVLDCK